VVSVVLKAVHSHADALRASIASPGNDHRLGANEAPPAIISAFLGSMLAQVFESVEKGTAASATEAQIINLGVSQIPDISKDYTDRNRTSPFAFTGNKFEFRAVGASANVSVPVAILNAAVASAFKDATARLKVMLTKKSSRDEAVMGLVQELSRESKAVRFEGNNYSVEWQKEAKKRGLPVLDTCVEALEVFNTPKSVQFLADTKVLSPDEIASRYHIAVERYVKSVEIELNTLVEMVSVYLVPALERQLTERKGALASMTLAGLKKVQTANVKTLEEVFLQVLTHLESLKTGLDGLHRVESEADKMKAIAKKLLPLSVDLRKACDTAETIVSDDLWPLPKYREMLFTVNLS
jgi:glutamine synthetase